MINFKTMDEVEGVLVTYNFDYAWVRSTSFMYPKTALATQIRHSLAFFATSVTSECHPLPNEAQRVVVEFSFHGGRWNSTCAMKVKFATKTTITKFQTNSFIAEFTISICFIIIIVGIVKENKRMFCMQGMVQHKG